MSRLWQSAAVLGLASHEYRRDRPRTAKRPRLAAAAAFALGALIAVAVLELIAAVLS